MIEAVTVRQRMHQLTLLLAERPRVEFESLFLDRVWSSERELRSMLVVTLMSVLEMVKLGLLGIQQPQGSETLSLERVVDVDAMESAIAEFVEDDEVAPASEAAAEPSAEASDAGLEVVESSDAVELVDAVEPAVEPGREDQVAPAESDDEPTVDPEVELESEPSGETPGD